MIPDRTRVLLGPWVTGVLYFLSALSAFQLPVTANGSTLVWPATGFLIGVVLWVKPRHRLHHALAGAIASLSVNALMGFPLPVTLTATVANMAELWLALVLIRRLCGPRPDFSAMRHLWRFCVLSVVVAAVGATIGNSTVGNGDFWMSWFLTDLLGITIMVPFVLSVLNYATGTRSLRPTRGAAEVSGLLALVLVVTIATFAQSRFPLLFVPVAALSLATHRLGAFGTVAGLIIIILVGSVFTTLGMGPVSLIRAGPEARSLFCQFYIAVCFLSTVPIATRFAAERASAQRAEVSDRVHRTIIERSSDAIFETDPIGRWTFLSPAWEGITGRPIADSIGRSYLSAVDPRDRGRALDTMAQLYAGDMAESKVEVRVAGMAAEPRWVQVTNRLIRDGGNAIVGTYGTIRDVTDRARAEHALKVSERRYRLLAENATDIIFCLGESSDATYISPSAEALLGIPGSEALGIRGGRYTHPDDLRLVADALSRLRGGGSASEIFTYRMRHRDGRWLWIEVSARVATNEEGQREVVGVARDITGRKQVEEDALAAREAAEAAAQVARIQADTDELTGLASRRLFLRQLEREIETARDRDRPLSLAMIDVDHFKRVNDGFGHLAGDRVLRIVATAALGAVRGGDIVGRVGGEEFAVLMPGAEASHAVAVGERLRIAVAAATATVTGLPAVTVSVGIASRSAAVDGDEFMAEADRALYAAKAAGRDCLFLAA